jgi:DNA mismatch repair protein MLH3
MPVRVKQRAIELEKRPGSGREWEDLRKGVIKLVLAWPLGVGILIKDGPTGQKIHFQAPRQADSMAMSWPESNLIAHICNTLAQGLLISSPEQTNWVAMNGATREIHIHGAMSLDPAPTKAIQFVSLGISPVGTQGGNNILYEEINRLFENSSFGSLDDKPDLGEQERTRRYEDRRYKSDGFTYRELRGSKKGTDRWPMFFFKIDIVDPAIRNVATAHDDSLVAKGSLLTSIVDLLRAMILEFLKCHHIQIKSTRPSKFPQIYPSGDMEDSSHLESGANTDRDIDCNEKTVQSHSNQCDSRFVGRITRSGSQRMNNTGGKLESSLAIQTRSAESLFNMWPRVKSGRSKLVGKISEQHGDPESSLLETTNGRQDSSTSRSIARLSSVSTSLSGFTTPCINHTLAKSGKMIQLPFKGLPNISSKNPALSRIQNDYVQISEAANSDGDDEMLTWTNPVTNESSLVNARTGLVVQSARDGVPSRIVSSNEPRSLGRVSVRDNINLIEASRQSNERSAWIEDIVKNWKNPTFSPTEIGIPQVSLGYADAEPQQPLYRDGRNHSQFEIEKAIRTLSVSLAGRISKTALRQAQLISQVDKKFILIKIPLDIAGLAAKKERNVKRLLAIVDQHAADERCHVEDLLAELCSEPCIDENIPREAGPRSGVSTMPLEKPLNFAMSEREVELLRTFSQHFADWGILFDLPLMASSTDQRREERVKVRSLPPGIIERCKADPKLLIDLLRSEAWRCHEKVSAPDSTHGSPGENQVPAKKVRISKSHAWLQRIHRCPQGILDILNSRSCRSKANSPLHFRS